MIFGLLGFPLPWAISILPGVVLLVASAVITLLPRLNLLESIDRSETTPGAQRQLDGIREVMHGGLKAMAVAVLLITFGFAATGWQIKEAFNRLSDERNDRIGASASINTFLCQRIDSVGNGVAALVRVSLENSPPPEQLEPAQRFAYDRFQRYAIQQERPPRCRELALKIATLTGADPADVTITPIRLHGNPQPKGESRSAR